MEESHSRRRVVSFDGQFDASHHRTNLQVEKMNKLGEICLKFLGTRLLVLIVAGMALAYGQTSAQEQTRFSGSPVQRPVSLTPEVVRILLASHPAKETFEILNDSEKQDPSKLFQAAEVHLSSSEEVDLIVIGLGPMRGTENLWFWVVRSFRKNPQVILFSGGDTLEVTDKKTHGYKDIGIVWMSLAETETTVYQFDGMFYKMRTANNFKVGAQP